MFVRVRATDTEVYCTAIETKRIDGRTRQQILGSWPGLSIDDAIEHLRCWLEQETATLRRLETGETDRVPRTPQGRQRLRARVAQLERKIATLERLRPLVRGKTPKLSQKAQQVLEQQRLRAWHTGL
jgi:hypothetical protein